MAENPPVHQPVYQPAATKIVSASGQRSRGNDPNASVLPVATAGVPLKLSLGKAGTRSWTHGKVQFI